MTHTVETLQAEAQRLATSVDTDRWELGRILYRLSEKLHQTEFHEWCARELSFTPRNCRDLIRVSMEFTKEDVRKYCYTKLRLVLQARTPKLKEHAMEMLRQGASRRRIAEEIGQKGKRQPKYDVVYREVLSLPAFELRRLYRELRERFEAVAPRRKRAAA